MVMTVSLTNRPVCLQCLQVSRAAAVALPVNAMLLGVSGSTQGIVSDRGVSLREQVPQLQYLHSLGNHCSDDWADLIEAQFTYNEFNEYSPTAEVILPISGADSKAVHLHITIGEVPGALYETAFVTEQVGVSSYHLRSYQPTWLML